MAEAALDIEAERGSRQFGNDLSYREVEKGESIESIYSVSLPPNFVHSKFLSMQKHFGCSFALPQNHTNSNNVQFRFGWLSMLSGEINRKIKII